MGNFILLVGISGSGKSTYADPETTILDSDAAREELFGDVTYQGNNALVFETMRKRAICALKEGRDVTYCATNLSMKRRKELLAQLPPCRKICVVMATPFETCLARNAGRERRVPEYVLRRQLAQFQVPVFNEGWDEIVVQRVSNYKDELEYLKRAIFEFGNQFNFHHSLSLLDHCTKTQILAPANLSVAAFFHDCGKPFTFSRDEDGVGHFYGHASVGSYYALCAGLELRDSALICYHMAPFDLKGWDTWRKRLGDKLWNDAIRLHEADKEAHQSECYDTLFADFGYYAGMAVGK